VVIDLSHGGRGVRAVAATLAQSVGFAPSGAVHLAVADPGVGTSRTGVVLVTASGALLVGPDNGVLVPAADALGGISDAFELTEPRFRLESVSATFHGRDIFAPAAAHLALGVDPSEFGPRVTALVRPAPPRLLVSDGVVEADVLRTDWYGNVQLAATAAHISSLGTRVRVNDRPAAVVRTFGDLSAGGLGVLVDASGHLSVVVNGGSAYEELDEPAHVRIVRG
jgi:S-adenosylmethionine hydrolase